jgi:2-oxoglutarate ferredoxin oxidoreductase subunit beta
MEPVQSYMTEPCSIPFCKGCGHGHVLRKLNDALVSLQIDPAKVCLVTDIGCIGLADSLFALPHTVHTTHGRSTAFATGIELADAVLSDSALKTVVLIGDGGAMIGLLHLVNAALLNADVTVILCNNYLFGMTGGQNSAFSPLDFVTATTPKGNVIPPLDICRLMIDSNAGFVARKLATDLAGTIADAVAFPGFAMVEVVELCTEFGAKRNQLSGSVLQGIVESHNQQLGVLRNEGRRKDFGPVYSAKFPPDGRKGGGKGGGFIGVKYPNTLRRTCGIVIAGSAGEKVQSAASMLCGAAALSGLHSTQKNDNPVTQGSGFSLAEVCLSPGRIDYTGIEEPDAVVVVSENGSRELTLRGVLGRCRPSTLLIRDEGLDIPQTSAGVMALPLRKTFTPARAALGALSVLLAAREYFPAAALHETISLHDPDLARTVAERTSLALAK